MPYNKSDFVSFLFSTGENYLVRVCTYRICLHSVHMQLFIVLQELQYTSCTADGHLKIDQRHVRVHGKLVT